MAFCKNASCCGFERLQIIRQSSIGPTEFSQHFARVWPVEQVDQRRVVALDEVDFEVRHETSDGQPEVVADHQQTLQPHAIALPQRSEQFPTILVVLAVQPLLKLVDHQQQFLASRQALPAADRGQILGQAATRRGRKELLLRCGGADGFRCRPRSPRGR